MESVSCITCRRRKVKCDRRPVPCANCARFGAPCSYQYAPLAASTATSASASGPGLGPRADHRRGVLSSTPTTTQAGLQRRRILRSCTACKRAKAKCSGGASCTRCTRRAIACVYDGSRRGASVPSPTPTTTAINPAPVPATGSVPTRMNPPAADDPSDTFPSPVSAEPDTSRPASSPHLPNAAATAVPDWLTAPDLPPMERLRSLLDSYFSRIHPLRCMGFLHMPTFFERLRDPQALYADKYGLVHAICALAAPFHYADLASVSPPSPPTPTTTPRFYNAGSGWVATAMLRIFDHLGTPDIESLMTEMLVYEYYLRSGEYAKAFMLSGVVARHVQVLQFNLEHDYDLPSQQRRSTPSSATISWAAKESRRRLVWCCFLQDAFMECGIDQLRFVNPADIQVQLPCTEELFARGKPCLTEMLTPGRLLPFVDAAPTAGAASAGAANLDLRAFYIRAMAVRAKVLKYVKHLQGDVPWSSDPRESRFVCLDREIRALEASLPDELRMTPENACVFRWSGWSGAGGSGRLGLYYGLHILLAQTFNDLYRVGVANLVFPHHATQWIRTNAPLAFLLRCHRMCCSKAVKIATLLEELWQTDRLGLVDTPYAMHAQVCSSVLVMTLISWQALLRSRQSGHSGGGGGGTDDLGTPAEGFDSADPSDGAGGPDSLGDVNGLDLDPLAVPVFLPQHRRLLQSNVLILDFLRTYVKADLYYESARQALRRFEQLEAMGSSTDDGSATANSGAAADPPQFSLEYILNPLGVYPMARQQARNRHAPDASVAASAPTKTANTQSTQGGRTTRNKRNTHNVQTTRTTQTPHTTHTQGMPVSDIPVQNPPTAPAGGMMQHHYPPRLLFPHDTSPTLVPTGHTVGRHDLMQSPLPPLSQQAMAGGLDAEDAGELSLFQMWDWELEVPSMDNMGYPTFL